MDLSEKIQNLKNQIDEDIAGEYDLDELYLKYFSKKSGLVTDLIKELPKLSKEEKLEFGPKINSLQEEYKTKIEAEKARQKNSKLLESDLDLTLPLPPKESGYLHPTTQVIRELNKFFRYHGFSVYEGPEIETDEYNFRRLNLPEDHPATDLMDSLFIKSPSVLLRTNPSS